jgi:hypothetical protein
MTLNERTTRMCGEQHDAEQIKVRNAGAWTSERTKQREGKDLSRGRMIASQQRKVRILYGRLAVTAPALNPLVSSKHEGLQSSVSMNPIQQRACENS